MEIQSTLDWQVKGLTFVVDRAPNPDWKLISHTNPQVYILAYAKSGSAQYYFDDKLQQVRKGNVIFVKRGQVYTAYSDPDMPWGFYSAGFYLEPGNTASAELLDTLPNIFSCSDSSHMAENFAELNRVWSAKNAGYLIKCRSLLLDILYILLSDEFRRGKTSAHYAKIEEIVDMMRRNYDKSYSIETLCELSGLSSSHFRMLFKQMTGMTTVQFQNQLKIDKAKDLIISRSCNVTEASKAVGFSDVFYFSRMFRKLTGKNPSEYLN